MNQLTGTRGKYIVTIPGLMVGLTFLYCIFFPADKMNIKEIILLVTLFVCLPSIVKWASAKNNVLLFFYALVYPLFTTLVSVTIGDSSIGGALSYGYVWIFLLLIPAIVDHNIDVAKPFLFATTIVALIVDFIYLADVFGIISIYSNPLIRFFYSMKEMQWGKGLLATFGYSIFYKSSPLIIFTFGYALHQRKYIWAGILFLSFVASGTRANLLVGIFILAAIPLLCGSKKPSKKIAVGLVIFAAALFIAPNLIDRMSALNQLKYGRSEEIKLEAIYSIFNHMNAAPYRYIFGSGVGSYFYSSGRNALVDVVEVSFFDYFRQVGVFGFSLFVYFLVRPMKWLYKNQKWVLICLLGYLAVAFTNPLLVTSTSFMAYVLILCNGFGDFRMSLMRNDLYSMNTDS